MTSRMVGGMVVGWQQDGRMAVGWQWDGGRVAVGWRWDVPAAGSPSAGVSGQGIPPTVLPAGTAPRCQPGMTEGSRTLRFPRELTCPAGAGPGRR